MKPQITPKQKQVLDFINQYFQNNKYPPSLKEIATHFKKSIPTIHQFTQALIAKGYLDQASTATRNITPASPSRSEKSARGYRLGIIGYGIVGQAVAYGFSRYQINIYDKYKHFSSLSQVVNHSDYIFVCLPTPIMADESGRLPN
jgi:SOS-response transcriptional repressor LexA